jgi:hypothetical protein
MKRPLHFCICLFLLTIGSYAQTSDTFDIATFTPPSGWTKETKAGAVVFTTSDESKGTFAMLTLYRSGKSSGSAKNDFENDWREFIAGQLGVKEKPQIEPPAKGESWESVTGASDFKSELGPAVVVMNTFSGNGRSFSLAAVFNNEDYLPAIGAFVSSIRLDKSTANTQPPAKVSDNTAVVGTWGVSHSDQSTFSVNNAVSGYIAREYTFNADGTYRFISKTFDPFSTKLLFAKETGTYRISGDLLTITPKTSVLEGWSKKNGSGDKWGTRLDSQNRKLETITYRFTKHYFSGIQTTSLVLQAGNVTQRDGAYVGGGAFDNAWIYSPPCQQCFIEMPR